MTSPRAATRTAEFLVGRRDRRHFFATVFRSAFAMVINDLFLIDVVPNKLLVAATTMIERSRPLYGGDSFD